MTQQEALFALLVLLSSVVADKQRIVIHDGATSQATAGSRSGESLRNYRPGVSTVPVTSRACAPGSVLRVDFAPSSDGDGRIYANIFGSGVLLAHTDDVFEYEIMWKDKECNCGAEFEVGAQYRLRDHGPLDAQGYSPHSERNANMSKVALGKWYKRQWSMAPVEGKYVDKFVLSAFTQPGVTVTAFFKYIRVVRGGNEVRRAIFDAGMEPANVNTFFPGAITTSCQHEVILDGDDISLRSSVMSPNVQAPNCISYGETVALDGVIVSKSLAELAIRSAESRAASTGGVQGSEPLQCPFFATWMDEMAWYRAYEDQRVVIQSVVARMRLTAHPSVTLFVLSNWNSTLETEFLVERNPIRQTYPPWHFHSYFVVPQRSILTHLLNESTMDVAVEYQVRLVDGTMSSSIRSVVKSLLILLCD